MIFVYILILIATYLLWLYVGLSQILAAALAGMSLLALLYEGLSYIIQRVRLYLAGRREGLRMLSYVSHLSGLPVLPQQRLMLGLDRERIVLSSPSFSETYHRGEVEAICLTPAKRGLDAPEIAAFIDRHRPEKKYFLGAMSEHYLPRHKETLLVLAVRPEGEQAQVIVLAARASQSRLMKQLRRLSWSQVEEVPPLTRKESR